MRVSKEMQDINSIFQVFSNMQTERCKLRELENRDVDNLFDIYKDEETVLFQGVSSIQTKDEVQEILQRFKVGYEKEYFVKIGIEEKVSEKLIGIISLYAIDRLNNNLKIGFVLNREYWRKGIMSEVAKPVILFLFSKLGINRLEAWVHPDNIASVNLCKKLGFTKEGVFSKIAINTRTNKYEDRICFARLTTGHYEGVCAQ